MQEIHLLTQRALRHVSHVSRITVISFSFTFTFNLDLIIDAFFPSDIEPVF